MKILSFATLTALASCLVSMTTTAMAAGGVNANAGAATSGTTVYVFKTPTVNYPDGRALIPREGGWIDFTAVFDEGPQTTDRRQQVVDVGRIETYGVWLGSPEYRRSFPLQILNPRDACRTTRNQRKHLQAHCAVHVNRVDMIDLLSGQSGDGDGQSGQRGSGQNANVQNKVYPWDQMGFEIWVGLRDRVTGVKVVRKLDFVYGQLQLNQQELQLVREMRSAAAAAEAEADAEAEAKAAAAIAGVAAAGGATTAGTTTTTTTTAAAAGTTVGDVANVDVDVDVADVTGAIDATGATTAPSALKVRTTTREAMMEPPTQAVGGRSSRSSRLAKMTVAGATAGGVAAGGLALAEHLRGADTGDATVDANDIAAADDLVYANNDDDNTAAVDDTTADYSVPPIVSTSRALREVEAADVDDLDQQLERLELEEQRRTLDPSLQSLLDPVDLSGRQQYRGDTNGDDNLGDDTNVDNVDNAIDSMDGNAVDHVDAEQSLADLEQADDHVVAAGATSATTKAITAGDAFYDDDNVNYDVTQAEREPLADAVDREIERGALANVDDEQLDGYADELAAAVDDRDLETTAVATGAATALGFAGNRAAAATGTTLKQQRQQVLDDENDDDAEEFTSIADATDEADTAQVRSALYENDDDANIAMVARPAKMMATAATAAATVPAASTLLGQKKRSLFAHPDEELDGADYDLEADNVAEFDNATDNGNDNASANDDQLFALDQGEIEGLSDDAPVDESSTTTAAGELELLRQEIAQSVRAGHITQKEGQVLLQKLMQRAPVVDDGDFE